MWLKPFETTSKMDRVRSHSRKQLRIVVFLGHNGNQTITNVIIVIKRGRKQNMRPSEDVHSEVVHTLTSSNSRERNSWCVEDHLTTVVLHDN